jgi:hypothetical protein
MDILAVTDVDELPGPLATRLDVLENLVRQAEPENCGALRDVETIVGDTLSLIENSLTIESVAQSAILDCLTLADELMHVGIYWGDAGNIETVRAQALAAIAKFSAALLGAVPSEAARARDLAW